ncbi:CBASS cGAMP-activated phospholipase [Bacillus massilinigeriensis]|uniref:CBASS cGAMP-activated phospholipase n=1 Tax=Bacillus mediterraneensis TaxID=1805474 RepID=UPI0008F890A6|nr:CBASS cGAMP-activated phospholipase [Bacillus mediterraneensis]
MRILCIDGGGIRGALPISFLAQLEEEKKEPASHYFDMIAGTSTGAIIAASIAVGIPMKTLLENYIVFGKKIFTAQAYWGIFRSVYNDRFLRRLLKKSFGNMLLKDVQMPLLLPAVDLTHGNPIVIKSCKVDEIEQYHELELWDAVLSSCAAPLYFPPNHLEGKYMTADGGLWANNPSLVGLTEAIHSFSEKVENINILSLGTGRQCIDFSNDKDGSWGIRSWLPMPLPVMKPVPKLLDLALDLSSEAVSHQCQLMLGERYLRINHDLGREVPFDEPVFLKNMVEHGYDAFHNNKEQVLPFLQT